MPLPPTSKCLLTGSKATRLACLLSIQASKIKLPSWCFTHPSNFSGYPPSLWRMEENLFSVTTGHFGVELLVGLMFSIELPPFMNYYLESDRQKNLSPAQIVWLPFPGSMWRLIFHRITIGIYKQTYNNTPINTIDQSSCQTHLYHCILLVKVQQVRNLSKLLQTCLEQSLDPIKTT